MKAELDTLRARTGRMEQELDEIECCFFCSSHLRLSSGKGGGESCVLTASDGKVVPGVRNFHAVWPGKTWVKLDTMPGIRPASALDFTRMPFRKAPAGADGRLERKLSLPAGWSER